MDRREKAIEIFGNEYLVDLLIEYFKNLKKIKKDKINDFIKKYEKELKEILPRRNWRPWLYVKKKRYRGEMNKLKGRKIVVSNMENNLSGNEKRIQSCKIVGGDHKREGHKKEKTFNEKYNPGCKTLTMKAESDCQISEEHQILDKLKEKVIIKDKQERNTSNKSGGSIQLTLGNIPELNGENNLEWIQDKANFTNLLQKYLKKSESDRPADLLVYDTGGSRIFFNIEDVINYMVENCMFRKIESGRIKGDFKDNSKNGKRQYFTYEYRSRHKSYFLGFSGGKGRPFIDLLKTKIKYYEDPY